MKIDFKKEKLFKKNNGVAHESKERKGARCPTQVNSEAAVSDPHYELWPLSQHLSSGQGEHSPVLQLISISSE